MKLCISTAQLPGIHPHITRYDPHQQPQGKDNVGTGYTEHGERFLIKLDHAVAVAEFVGARVSQACGLPVCQPSIVTIDTRHGITHAFGSRIEAGLHKFDPSDISQWQNTIRNCTNRNAFSAILAIDLTLGNDDRHWGNWLIQQNQQEGQSAHSTEQGSSYLIRALDFSRAWPHPHPAQHPLRHRSVNTWRAAQQWDLLGIEFCQRTFFATCTKIAQLPSRWLRSIVLQPLVGVFLTASQVNELCSWWEQSLHNQVIEAIHSLEYGVWQ